MNTPSPPTAMGSLAGAHLLIHTSDDAPVGLRWRLQTLLQQVCEHLLAPAHPAPAMLALEIHDQQGQRVLALELAGTLVDVVLAPGIYRVTARCSKTRRSYTVALSPGSTFDLHLHLPLGHPAP